MSHRSLPILLLVLAACTKTQDASKDDDGASSTASARPAPRTATAHDAAPGVPPAPPEDASSVAGPPVRVVAVVAGEHHTCAHTEAGKVRCWGDGTNGRLGYGNTRSIGDDEPASAAGEVDLDGRVVQLAAGFAHTCALLDTGAVRCWGRGDMGQLGHGNTEDIGDDETPASAGDVPVGGHATQIAAGGNHTCILLEGGVVRCWGDNQENGLGYGYGKYRAVGDDETPASVGDVPLGQPATRLAVGLGETCAILATADVRCWGPAYGMSEARERLPWQRNDIDLGTKAVSLFAYRSHACISTSEKTIRCWGDGFRGQLGYPGTNVVANEPAAREAGYDATPRTVGDVDVGGPVHGVAVGGEHTCALLAGGAVRCWGWGKHGQLGHGNARNIGDHEPPAAAGDVPLGAPATALAAGDHHTCAVLATGAVRCWGWGKHGQLGHGNARNIGDHEPPAAAGDVPL